MNAYKSLGVNVSHSEAEILLGQIRLYVSQSKKTPSIKKLENFYYELNRNADKRMYASL